MYEMPMGIEQIEKCIPHRYPFLLIDRVVQYVAGVSLEGLKNVSATDPILQGHFPGHPVMPGVLQIEALAQLAAVFGKLEEPARQSVLLTEVSEARFRRQVVPGDTLLLHVNCLKRRQSFFWFEGIARVGEHEAMRVSFSAKLG